MDALRTVRIMYAYVLTRTCIAASADKTVRSLDTRDILEMQLSIHYAFSWQ